VIDDVRVQLVPGLELLSWSPEDGRRVVELVESSLRAAGGTWRATVRPSVVRTHLWFVEIVRGEDARPARSVVFDDRALRPEADLLQAIVEMAAGPGPRPPETPAGARRGPTAGRGSARAPGSAGRARRAPSGGPAAGRRGRGRP
jgi:hypothetical protein